MFDAGRLVSFGSFSHADPSHLVRVRAGAESGVGLSFLTVCAFWHGLYVEQTNESTGRSGHEQTKTRCAVSVTATEFGALPTNLCGFMVSMLIQLVGQRQYTFPSTHAVGRDWRADKSNDSGIPLARPDDLVTPKCTGIQRRTTPSKSHLRHILGAMGIQWHYVWFRAITRRYRRNPVRVLPALQPNKPYCFRTPGAEVLRPDVGVP